MSAAAERRSRRSPRSLFLTVRFPPPPRRARAFCRLQVPTRLWIAPPTRMDEAMLTAEGYYSIYGSAGARTEMPGCSLCMGNQARVADDCAVVSTSTRNFPNRLGKGANVFLASAELASVCAMLGRLPTPAEYLTYAEKLDATAEDTYRYLNFDQLPEYVKAADSVELSEEYWPALEQAKKAQSE